MTLLTGLGFEALSSPAPTSGAGTTVCSSWERAFRDALTPNWFHGPLKSHGEQPLARTPGGSSVLLFSAPGTSMAQVGSPRAVRADGARIVTHGETRGPVPDAPHGVRMTPPSRLAEGAPHPAAAQPAGASVPGTGRSKPPPIAAQARLVADRSSGVGVHVHAEAGAAGLHVWLGIAGDAERVATRSDQLLEALRRQADRSGQRLATVICNGRPILNAQAATASTNPQEDAP